MENHHSKTPTKKKTISYLVILGAADLSKKTTQLFFEVNIRQQGYLPPPKKKTNSTPENSGLVSITRPAHMDTSKVGVPKQHRSPPGMRTASHLKVTKTRKMDASRMANDKIFIDLKIKLNKNKMDDIHQQAEFVIFF